MAPSWWVAWYLLLFPAVGTRTRFKLFGLSAMFGVVPRNCSIRFDLPSASGSISDPLLVAGMV